MKVCMETLQMKADTIPAREDILQETQRFEILGGIIERLPPQAATYSSYGVKLSENPNTRRSWSDYDIGTTFAQDAA